VVLIPSGKGVFEVMLDDDLVYSKKVTGRHADPKEVLDALGARIQ
jgi:selT/selW/selH-like putative selenoprotein